jgi:hypothetical protein
MYNESSPEQREFEKKKSQLTEIENKLAEFELEYATTNAELRDFQYRYAEMIVRRLHKLDKIEEQIAKHLIFTDPDYPDYRRRLKEIQERIAEAEESFDKEKEQGIRPDFKPTDNIKALYRETAKKIHPDLATNEKERERRGELMAEVNAAYQAGDEQRLKQILDEWQYCPDNIEGEDTGAQLIRMIRKISRVQKRIEILQKEIRLLKSTEPYQLKEKVEKSQQEGIDLLKQMADYLTAQIIERSQYLEFLQKGGS